MRMTSASVLVVVFILGAIGYSKCEKDQNWSDLGFIEECGSLGCTDGEIDDESTNASKSEGKEPAPEYLLVFAINTANLNPVIIEDCSIVRDSRSARIGLAIKNLGGAGFRCEKSPDIYSWTCINKNNDIVAKALIMKSKSECRLFPGETARKMRTIFNK